MFASRSGTLPPSLARAINSATSASLVLLTTWLWGTISALAFKQTSPAAGRSSLPSATIYMAGPPRCFRPHTRTAPRLGADGGGIHFNNPLTATDISACASCEGDSRQRPNKRLKLRGALVLKEAVVSCPGGHGTSSTTLA